MRTLINFLLVFSVFTSQQILAQVTYGVTTITNTAGTAGIVDGPLADAKFNGTQGLAKDASGNIYVVERAGGRIRKIDFSTGQVTTIAGDNSKAAGSTGLVDGNGTTARFYEPTDVVVDSHGNLFVADMKNNCIRKITPSGDVALFAGSPTGTSGKVDGTGTAASFYFPFHMVIDANDNLYVTDRANHLIRKVTPDAVVTTIAGSTLGSVDGIGTSAKFDNPAGIDISSNGDLYISDAGTTRNKLRKITLSTMNVTTIAGSGAAGTLDGQDINATFCQPLGVAVDKNGDVYVCDFGFTGSTTIVANTIRKININSYVTTIAGASGYAGLVDDRVGTNARFKFPTDLLYDELNNCLWVSDNGNSTIRRVNLNEETSAVSNTEIKYGFSVFPTIANESIYINLNDRSTLNSVISIYDVTGKIHYERKIDLSNGEANIKLPHMSSGLYYINVQGIGKSYFIKK